ncbi:MAG TPA: putative DNA-binding domain-containing protein [Chlamydiales bacterium]|nr:putative DNA-binding domain-containing protein [Chlamydiales bacterium]
MTEVPESLSEMQIWFARQITSPIKESDSAHIPLYPPALIEEIRNRISPGLHLTSEERIGIYQQQYWWRLFNICQEIFPSLVRFFNYEDFNDLIAEPYLLKYPPSGWFLSDLGSNLPKWIREFYRKSDAALVLGLALIDLGYEKLLFTELLPPINPNAICEWEMKTLLLQPYVLLFEFDADLFSFRSHLMEHPPQYFQINNFPPIDNNGKKRYFVLYRSQETSLCEEISAEFFHLLSRFKKGTTLAALMPFLKKCNHVFELFQIMGARGWLTYLSQAI